MGTKKTNGPKFALLKQDPRAICLMALVGKEWENLKSPCVTFTTESACLPSWVRKMKRRWRISIHQRVHNKETATDWLSLEADCKRNSRGMTT